MASSLPPRESLIAQFAGLEPDGFGDSAPFCADGFFNSYSHTFRPFAIHRGDEEVGQVGSEQGILLLVYPLVCRFQQGLFPDIGEDHPLGVVGHGPDSFSDKPTQQVAAAPQVARAASLGNKILNGTNLDFQER